MTPTKRRGFKAITSILALSFPTIVVSNNVNFDNANHAKCPGGLKCHHGGECATGDKQYADHPVITSDLPWLEELNVNGEHCINCHDGWGGVDCNRRFQVCDEHDPSAPTCFNGSTCYKMGISQATRKYEYMCDCTDAEHDGRRYAGQYCQHVREEQCDEEMFCTNGGKCQSLVDIDSPDASIHRQHKHFICDCPDHRAGTHCEFLQVEGFTDCRLKCDRGVCAKGFKSYDNLIGTGPFPAALAFDIISSGGEHCVCPDGWTGLRCEIPVQRCGAKTYCYNGSTCAYDERGQPMCDCNSAHTDDVSYAGLSCEQESTSHCQPGLDQDQKDAFCTNHGRCIEDSDNRHKGCICEDGWSGDLCDIQGEVEPVCDLDCENGGSCRLGVKGYKDSYDELKLPVHAQKQKDGMYCSCPDGFTGLKCEVDINHCHNDGNDSEHFCLNGVPCAPDDPSMSGVDKKFSCQCDQSHDEISQMLVGRFCEYAVTEFCTEDEHRHSHSFCTNGGKCKRKNRHDQTEHGGCCCNEGYEGDYCQLPKGTLDASHPVTWSPLEECQHKKTNNDDHIFPVSPNANGEWEHVTINPAFQPKNDPEDSLGDDEEESEPVLTSAEPEEPQKKKNTGGIVTGILITLLVGGIAGVAYRKRDQKQDPHQFETNWWSGHNSEWWKGDTPIENDTNISPNGLGRTSYYPTDHAMSTEEGGDKKWEYSTDDDLHDVVI